MIIYEVNIQINAKIYDIFLSWLNSHAAEMLKFEGFKKYDIYKSIPNFKPKPKPHTHKK